MRLCVRGGGVGVMFGGIAGSGLVFEGGRV